MCLYGFVVLVGKDLVIGIEVGLLYMVVDELNISDFMFVLCIVVIKIKVLFMLLL